MCINVQSNYLGVANPDLNKKSVHNEIISLPEIYPFDKSSYLPDQRQ